MAKKPSSPGNPAAYLKLGMRAEFLKGISSVSVMPMQELQKYPVLIENYPSKRYAVLHVVEALSGLLEQLGELELNKTAAAAEPLQPMLKEMQDALKSSPQPQDVILRDPWAVKLIELIRSVVAVLGIELSERA